MLNISFIPRPNILKICTFVIGTLIKKSVKFGKMPFFLSEVINFSGRVPRLRTTALAYKRNPFGKHFSFFWSNVVFRLLAEFLGRTEIRLSDILSEKENRIGGGPLTKNLPLYETESGQIIVRIDLQLFT